MATFIAPRPRFVARRGNRLFAVVRSTYHPELVNALAESAARELLVIDPSIEIETFSAPGAFEIPVICARLADLGRYNAIITLGVIIQGETKHADLIAHSVTNSLQQIATQYYVPVIHEVLLVDNEAQARERCLGERINRGVEAARAAINAASTLERIQEELEA